MARKFFALENENLSMGDEGELEASDVQELTDGVQQTEVEAAEVDEVATAIEDAEVAVDNLEESAAILEAGVESGEGVSEETAQAVEVAVEAALNMLGASHRQRSLMPSLESWGSGQSRLAATRIALEGVTDKIKEIWNKIVEFVKMVAQKVVDFFVKFFDNTERLKKNAAKVRTKANEVGANAKIKTNTVKSGSVASYFNNGEGKSDFGTAKEVLSNHTAIAKAGEVGVKGITAAIETLKTGDSGAAKTKFEQASSGMVSVGSGHGALPSGDANKMREGFQSGILLGGRRIQVGIEVGDSTNSDGKNEVVFTPFMEVKEPEKKSTKEAATLNHSQVLELVKMVEDLASATEEYKKVQTKIKDLANATANLAKSAIQMADDNGSNAGARKAVTGAARVISRFCTMLPAWNVKAGNVALGYCTASIAQWEKSDAKK